MFALIFVLFDSSKMLEYSGFCRYEIKDAIAFCSAEKSQMPVEKSDLFDILGIGTDIVTEGLFTENKPKSACTAMYTYPPEGVI